MKVTLVGEETCLIIIKGRYKTAEPPKSIKITFVGEERDLQE
jgi:hypothetical protein